MEVVQALSSTKLNCFRPTFYACTVIETYGWLCNLAPGLIQMCLKFLTLKSDPPELNFFGPKCKKKIFLFVTYSCIRVDLLAVC